MFTDLSCVFCFIFIDEIHQEEPERENGKRGKILRKIMHYDNRVVVGKTDSLATIFGE